MRAPTGVLGVVHLSAMPGDPRGRTFAEVRTRALADAEALVAGGVDGLVVENFGSVPFAKGDLPPHQVAAMAGVVEAILGRTDRPVGINCLRNDARAAVGIAAATGAAFVRINVHVGAYVTDQGLIEGAAHDTLRYRASLDADVAILADVLVKHAAPLAPLEPEVAVRDCFDRGLADAVIVTGTGTGAPVDRALLQRVRAAAGDRPVLIGSGLSPDNAPTLAPLADGAIVGTYFKHGGDVGAPVDPDRVRALCEQLRGTFRQ